MASDEYDTSHPSVGYALVINQEYFSYDLMKEGFGRRRGTSVDERNVCNVLKGIGFDILNHSNLTANEIITVCEETSQLDHTDSDCFLLVIMSHGQDGVIYGTDEPLKLQEFIKYFTEDNCPSLTGKPKLVLVQACRGGEGDVGVDLKVDYTDSRKLEDSQIMAFPGPVEADFLFGYSTVPGYFSWRNENAGSWFIQSVCAVLKTHAMALEITKILTMVNWTVATQFESKTELPYKQSPCFTSTLTKDFYLKKKTFTVYSRLNISKAEQSSQ